MLIQQDLTEFKGFGLGAVPGKYFFSSGFKRTDKGSSPNWRMVENWNSPASEQHWFADLNSDVWSVGNDGNLYVSGTMFRAVGSSKGNGLIVDQKNRLLYARNQYLGSLDGVTFTDDWKNFGVSFVGFRPMELFEDMVLIGNKNNVAALFTSDDSFSTAALSLPSSFRVRCIKAGKTGVLIGANFQNRSYLILWDGNSLRSIAPWIYLPSIVLSITTDENGTWIVATENGLFITNGYSLQPYAQLPVKTTWNNGSGDLFVRGNILPSGTAFHDGKLFVAFTPDTPPTAKMPLGVWVFDPTTQLWEHITPPNGYSIKGSVGALFLDSSLRLNVSYSKEDGTPAYYTGFVQEGNPKKAVLITEELGQGNNPKHAEGLIATIRFASDNTDRYSSHDWTVTAKIYDFKRQLYGYGLTNGTSAALNQIKNTGATAKYQGAQAGDEVTILSGANAGQIRHITAIANPGTNTETWTLDANLPNLTESGVYVQVMPFKTIGTKSLTGSNDYYFNIKNRPKGKRFLVKYLFETSSTTTMIPELIGQSFIYDDNPTV